MLPALLSLLLVLPALVQDAGTPPVSGGAGGSGAAAAAGLSGASGVAIAATPALREGLWRAAITFSGGEIPFGLRLQPEAHSTAGAWRAWIVNGSEEIEIPQVGWVDGHFELGMSYYASRLVLVPSADGADLRGEWLQDRGSEVARMTCYAQAGELPRFPKADGVSGAIAAAAPLTGRWAVRFASDDDPSVGVFEQQADGTLTGTFLTTTGDYRYLAGDARAAADASVGSGLRLSCFDGAHAFLFVARLQPDGTLAGDFWSRGSFHDTWTAHGDEQAALPDAFDQVHWKAGARLDDVAFPDLDGRQRSLADPAFAGKARILQIFGSWCPNCADEAACLAELQRTYGPRGLSIVGIAFERTGDFDKDVVQVRRYAEHRGVTWPLLVAGMVSKDKATATLGLLDRIKSYPTTIFLHADGRVAAVHSGYCGPATGEAYVAQQREFKELVESLLAER